MSYRGAGTVRGPLHFDGTASPGLSVSNEGRIYYDLASNKFKVSENGGAYVDLATGGTTTLQGAYTNGGAGGGSIALSTSGGPLALSSTQPDNNSILTVTKNPVGAQSGSGISVSMGSTTTGDAILVDQTTGGSGNLVNLRNNSATKFSVSSTGAVAQSGKTATYNNIVTSGWGVPAIYGSGRLTAQTGAVASVTSYTVGAADGSFDVSGYVNITTSTTHSISVTVSYTDETSTARTLVLNLYDLNGVALTTITQVEGVGPYSSTPFRIRCKAGTTITVATTGVFTSVTYNVEATIGQVT